MYPDGDKKAYSESSQWTIQQNKGTISQLRQENKMLRAKLSRKMQVSQSQLVCHSLDCAHCSQADDDVISDVFHGHKQQPPAELRGVSGEVWTVTVLVDSDQSLCCMYIRWLYESLTRQCVRC